MTDQAPAGNGTRPALAEQHRAARDRLPASLPRSLPRLWPRLRLLLVGAAVGLAVGLAAAFAVSYQTMPIQTQHLERVWVELNGHRAYIVSGEVLLDAAPLSPTPTGQP